MIPDHYLDRLCEVAHGDCNVPQGWSKDPRLANWVSTQRKHKRKLDRGEPSKGMATERAARLTALGLVWEPPKGNTNQTEWEAQLAQLAAYKTAYGNCNVPNRWAEDPRLANWVSMQRKYKKKLDRGQPSNGMTAAWAAKLDTVGFEWSPSMGGGMPKEAAWEVQLARLVAYKAVHGECNVPQGWAEDPRLAVWVSNQRAGKQKFNRGEPGRGMTAERAARLTTLGLVWTPDKVAWEAQLAWLAATASRHERSRQSRPDKVVHGMVVASAN
jgi:hypothetical protein